METITNKISSRFGPRVHEAFQIKITTPPNHIYHAGDVVTGNVTLETTSKNDLSLEITLYGLGYVRWTEGQGKNQVIYKGHDDLFKVSTSLPVSTEQCEYPFSLQIPDISMLPWNSTVEHGYVQYGVEAVIQAPGIIKPRDNKVTVLFLLQSTIHPNLIPTSRNPNYFASTKTEAVSELKPDLCCFPLCWRYYCGQENIQIALKTKTLWVCAGSEIPYSFTVENRQTEREVKNIKIQLVGCWTRRVKNNDCLYKRMLEREEHFVCEESTHPIFLPPGENTTSQGVINIPPGLNPTQVECDVLRLTYRLQGLLEEQRGSRLLSCVKTEDSVKVDVIVAATREAIEPESSIII